MTMWEEICGRSPETFDELISMLKKVMAQDEDVNLKLLPGSDSDCELLGDLLKVESSLSKLTEENATLRAENERFGKRLTARVICLCGSTRFTEQMLVKQWELTKQGHIVVSWCALPDSYFGDGDRTHVGDQEGVKEIVDEVHKRKIDLCDEVFVMNVGDYVGHSTMSEIRYAYKIGRPINFLEEPRPRNPENVNDPDLPQPFPWELL